MKNLLSCLLCCLAPVSSLVANPMPLEVKVAVKVEERQKKDSGAPETTESRTLAIEIVNRSSTNYENISLEWTLYAKRLQRGAAMTIAQDRGTEKLSVAGGNARAEVHTKGVNFTWTPRHSEKSGSGRRAKFKRVDESGDRYHGYLVTVQDQNGNLIGRAVSHPAILNEEG